MASQWFYQTSEGQQSGPVDSRELRRLAEAGIIRPDTMVHKGASGRWVRAEKVRGLFQRSTPAPSSSPGATPPVPPPVPESGAPSRGVSGESPIRHGLGAVLVRSVNGPRDGAICALLMIAGMIYLCLSTESLSWQRILDNGFLVIAWFVVSLIITIVINTRSGIYRYTPQVQPPPEPVRPAPAVVSGPATKEAVEAPIASPPAPESGGLVNEASEESEPAWPFIAGAGILLGLLLWALVFRGGCAPQQPAEKDQPPLGAAESAPVEPSASRAAAPEAESKPAPATGNVKILELADLAELVGPSVVQVDVTGPEEAGTGSGFVLDKQGTIVTNFHVIEGVTAGRVVFSDRTSAPIAGYLGVWPEKDIALVRVECPPDKLHPLRLAKLAPRQGERVAAFGSPLGLQQSVSDGVVSAVRESEELRTLGPIGVNARLIQTTAPISPGNSGGPLVDMKGMVVGVNTMTFRPLDGENVNFAVAAVELPSLFLAKNETLSPLPASDPAANGVRRILRRGLAYLRKGDYDSAIADFTEAIRLDPKDANAYWIRGLAYSFKDDYDSAIADYTQAIRIDPKDAGAYKGRGSAYLGKDDYDSAIADYTEAIGLDPKDAEAYHNRGLAYLRKDDYDSAIADFTEAIRLDPKDANAYHNRGLAYDSKDEYDSAITEFTEAIRLDPKALTYFRRGSAYFSKNDCDSAIADFTEVVRLDPEDADAYEMRGLVYLLKHDYDSAITEFTEAIRLDPKNARAYSNRGWAHRDAGEYDRAIADYTEAIRIDPKDAGAYYGRGLAYEGKGQRAAAERDFAQAKRLGYKP